MATITAQLLVGESHTWHGGIMNTSAIHLYENSRPVWVYKQEHEGKKVIRWVSTVEDMLEDGLFLAAVHIWKDEDIIRTLRNITGSNSFEELELYNISDKDRDALYKKCREIDNGGKFILSVFNGSTLMKQVDVLKKYKTEYEVCLSKYTNEEKFVWYACYGSNLCKERFLGYIQGGGPKGNKGCEDKTLPLADVQYTIHHELYFANKSKTWDGGGVAFVDAEGDGKINTLGRAYLITEKQFEDVKKQEGASKKWYGYVLELGTLGGIPVRTLTQINRNAEDVNTPKKEYIDIICKGLKEAYPDMSDEKIKRYLNI